MLIQRLRCFNCFHEFETSGPDVECGICGSSATIISQREELEVNSEPPIMALVDETKQTQEQSTNTSGVESQGASPDAVNEQSVNISGAENQNKE